MPTYIAGKTIGMTFTPSGGSPTAIRCTNKSFKDMVDLLNVDDDGASGIQQVIAGFQRGDFTFTSYIDAAALYYGTARAVTPGLNGVVSFKVGASDAYSIPVMVESVTPQAPHNGVLSYDCSAKLNGLAGSFTRPTGA